MAPAHGIEPRFADSESAVLPLDEAGFNKMPLTAKGEEIKSALTKEYGEKKGEQVLYAGKNKGTFSGIDSDKLARIADGVDRLAARFDAILEGKPRAADIPNVMPGTSKGIYAAPPKISTLPPRIPIKRTGLENTLGFKFGPRKTNLDLESK